MKWYKKIFLKFIEWFRPEYHIEFVNELPETTQERRIYIVGEPNEHWLLAFNCPCGCRKLIQLNLLTDAKPRWKFTILTNGKIDISPSIWRTTGCKSHFFVRKAKIFWC